MSAAESYVSDTEFAVSAIEVPLEAAPPAVATINTGALKAALAKFVGIIPAKSSMPILRGIVIMAEGFHVTLRATNLDTALSLRLPASVTGACGTVAEYKALTAAVKGIRTPDTVITLSGEKILAEDTAGGLRSTVRTLGGTGDYPEPPQREAVTEENRDGFRDLAVHGATLAEGLRYVLPGVRDGAARYALSGVHWGDGQNSGVELAASNTHVLYTRTVPLTSGDQPGGADFILPSGAADWLARHAGDAGCVTVRTSPAFVSFDGPDWSLSGRGLDGVFPRYRDVMPSPDRLPGRLAVNRRTLLAALRTAAAHCSADARGIHLLPDMTGDALELRIVRNGNVEFAMTIPAASRKCRPMLTRADDLLKFLAIYPGDTVTIRYEDVGESEGPAAVYDDDRSFVFMPLNNEGLSEAERAEHARMLEAYRNRLSEPDQALPSTHAADVSAAPPAPSYRAVVARAKSDSGYLSTLLSALGMQAATL